MNAGIDCRSMKWHRGKLYVDNKIQGQIVDEIFVKCTTTSNEAIGTTTLEPGQVPLANTHADQITNLPASFAYMVPSNPSSVT